MRVKEQCIAHKIESDCLNRESPCQWNCAGCDAIFTAMGYRRILDNILCETCFKKTREI